MFVSIEPQAYFVERIGGKHVRVEVLVGPGQSPHTFDPTPKQMGRLCATDAFFRIGVPFENQLMEKLADAMAKVPSIDTREGVILRQLDGASGSHSHSAHEHGGGAHAGEDDPHIWLDPKRVKIQAANISKGLKRIDPDHAEDYEHNLAAFCADLDELDLELRSALAPCKGRPFFVFHDAYGYFAEAYGLLQMPVEAGGKEPSAKQLVGIIDRAKELKVKLIFVDPQFSVKSAQAIAKAIGGVVVTLDPLSRDYLANLRKMARDIGRTIPPESAKGDASTTKAQNSGGQRN